MWKMHYPVCPPPLFPSCVDFPPSFNFYFFFYFLHSHRVSFPLCLSLSPSSLVLSLSPSGCTFWGKKPWSRKKKILWQLGTLIGAPVGITLIAGIAVPAMVIGIPVYVGRKVRQEHVWFGLTVTSPVWPNSINTIIWGILEADDVCFYSIISHALNIYTSMFSAQIPVKL